MNIQVTSDNITVSPSMLALAKEKVAKMDHRLQKLQADAKEIRVVLNTMPDQQFEAKVEISVKGKVYFGHTTSFTLETALIEAVEDIDRQLAKEKSIIEKAWETNRSAKRYPTNS